jgi:hypothetical protein
MKSPRPPRLGRAEPPPAGVRAEPPGFSGVRFSAIDDEAAVNAFFEDIPAPAMAAAGQPLRVLALSGGGAGGAFGAGALVGLSRAGRRPAFDMVTGVSTGALIAPLAFLGADWDHRLTEAYAGGAASDLLALKGLRPGPSLYAGEPLAHLVGRYVDEALLAAVAAAHRQGRRLFVATSNLDAQSTSIWDMGAIAGVGGEAALRLFADVLTASASLPGLFPPRLIRVAGEGREFEEMHVDGGAITPLFVVPEPLVLRRALPLADRGVEVYALVNTTLEGDARATPMGAAPILMRSFELMLRSSYRSALRSVAAFCEINGFGLRTAAVPQSYAGVSMLRFEEATMRALFEHGAELGESGGLWTTLLAPEGA